MFGICLAGALILLGASMYYYRNRHLQDAESALEYKGYMAYLYPVAYIFHFLLREHLRIPFPEEKLKHMQMTKPGTSNKHLTEEYDCRRIGMLLLLLFMVFGLVAISIFGGKGKKRLKDSVTLIREEPGGGEKQAVLKMKGNGKDREIQVAIPERQYRPEELQAKLAEAKEYILSNVGGGNESLEKVNSPLVLMSKIPDSQITVSWSLDGTGYVNRDGTLNNDELKESIDVSLTAVLTYGDTKEQVPVELILYPRERSEEEDFMAQWNDQLEQEGEQSASQPFLPLPHNIGDKVLSYQEVNHPIWPKLLLGGLLLCGLMPILLDYQLEQNVRKRDLQLKQEYPEMVERFILLMGAGLTIRGAWQRIAMDYEQRRKNQEIGFHFLYEEMLLTQHDLENGKSETAAYTAFGRRVSLLQYMKFSTLLVQNLKKGSDDLLKRMNLEAEDALRARRELAKKMGEEAGTKLLWPMMMMLVIVFALIMMAAFQSM